MHAARAWGSGAAWRWILLPLAAAMLALDVSWTREVMESRRWRDGGVLGTALACGAALGAASGPGGLPAADGLWAALAAAPLLIGTALSAGAGVGTGATAAERAQPKPADDACMPMPK